MIEYLEAFAIVMVLTAIVYGAVRLLDRWFDLWL